MVMETVQIRITKGLLDKIDELVEKGIYSSRSEAARDGVRRMLFDESSQTKQVQEDMAEKYNKWKKS